MGYTIKDIASELGISSATVSLVINNKECRISDKTRQAVLDLVRKYNFTPNSSARALVTKKTQTIGLIVPDISNPFFAEFANGVEREAQKLNYSVIFCTSDGKSKKDIKNTLLLISKQVDGIIIVPSFSISDGDYIAQFNKLVVKDNLTVVLADRKIPNSNFNIVRIDHREGGFIATKHLLDLGHRKIGCITGPLNVEAAKERYNGYVEALRLYDIEPCEDLVVQGDYQVDSGSIGAQKLIKQGVTAIFACNDMMACGVIRQARIMGVSLGSQLSLIGFDDIPLCEILEQPLTTINQPVYLMGKSACQLIVDLISKPQTKKHNIMFLPSLITRHSTFKIDV